MAIGLVFLAIAHSGVVVHGAKCDNQKFQTCTESFAKALGFSNIQELLNKFGEILKEEGLNGQKRICTARNDYEKCLGDQYDACFSVDFLKSIGETAENATYIIGAAAQQKYICTSGWDVYSKNWACIHDAPEKYKEDFAKCQHDCEEKMKKDPGNKCLYLQGLFDCVSAVYNKACGPAASATECEIQKASIAPVNPACSFTCPKSPSVEQ